MFIGSVESLKNSREKTGRFSVSPGDVWSGGGSGSRSQPKTDISQVECYKCKKLGHYANECPEKKVEGPNKPNPFHETFLITSF